MRLSGLLCTIEKIALIQTKNQDNQESSLSKQLEKVPFVVNQINIPALHDYLAACLPYF